MQHYYRTIAEREFGHEPNMKIREALAEQYLIQKYLEADHGGFFIEVGANDAFDNSQTWHLEHLGWDGILVEPIPMLCKKLRENRPKSVVVEAACGGPDSPPTAIFTIAEQSGKSTLASHFLDNRIAVESKIEVKMQAVDQILEEQEVKCLDFVSIDVEGTQFEVLRGFDLQRWKPRLLLVEDNLLDLKTHSLILSQQYKLVKRTVFNNWYIPIESTPPETCRKENRLLQWKLRRVPLRAIRFRLRQLIGKGI